MIELVKKYYKAWETKDLELLKATIHKDIYGVRTYLEDKLFEVDDLFNNFMNSDIQEVVITKYEELEEVVKLVLTINQNKVAAKFTFKDNKIYKVYEEIPATNRRIKCVCSYDGTGFSGFQKQLNANSIQETIEKAITKAFSLKEDARVHSSGRTDKGVHALNQVFHFDLNPQIPNEKIQLILNSTLPDSILIKSTEDVEHTFHSRYDVLEKEYVYKINTNQFNPIQRNYEWFIKDFDITKFDNQLKQIIGTHNFTSFTKTNKLHSNIRTIFDAYIVEEDGFVYVHIKGSGFLRYMVRNIVSAIVANIQGVSKYSIKDLIKLQDVNLIKEKAPASGLYLYNVKY